MKNKIITSIICLFMLPISPFALSHDAVRDSSGNFVRDSKEDCVRTQTVTEVDPCAANVSAVGYAHIMGMLERIIYFDFDQSRIKSSEEAKLKVLAEALRKHNVKAIKVVGYTDKIGTDSYNNRLSEKRANAVVAYLNSLVQLDSSITEVRGLGKASQVVDCTDKTSRKTLIDCLAPNRRVEVEVDYYNKD